MLLLIFFATGLLAGTVDAIAGGGGLISMPVLLGLGLPPSIALGTNKLQSVCGTGVAAYTYFRQGLLNRQGLLRGLIFSVCGSILGALSVQVIANDALKKVIPVLLLLVFAYMIFCPRLGRQDEKAKWSLNAFYLVFGSALGFYDGFLGPGAGGFWGFFLMYLLGYNVLKATAYTKFFNASTNLAALICFALSGNIDYRIGLAMACGQLIGGRIGAQVAMKKGARLIRPLFLMMMLAAILTLVYRDNSDWSSPYRLGFAAAFILLAIFYAWKMRKRKILSEGA